MSVVTNGYGVITNGYDYTTYVNTSAYKHSGFSKEHIGSRYWWNSLSEEERKMLLIDYLVDTDGQIIPFSSITVVSKKMFTDIDGMYTALSTDYDADKCLFLKDDKNTLHVINLTDGSNDDAFHSFSRYAGKDERVRVILLQFSRMKNNS